MFIRQLALITQNIAAASGGRGHPRRHVARRGNDRPNSSRQSHPINPRP